MQSRMIQLEEYLKALCQAIHNGAYKNEAEVRSEFMRNVRNFLDVPDFKGVSIREEESIIEGRPDARIGGLLIEFESPFDEKGRIRESVTEEKVRKVQEKYLQECRQRTRPARAMITNGLELVFLDENGNLVERGLVC
ncbi:MAG TPA: hypothetical protein VMW36_07515 [Patescibacteria group bacterium]|nr:hypothetical protein [Patescibacteria group bacterium]